MGNMEKSMAQILKRLAIRPVSHGGMTQALLPLVSPSHVPPEKHLTPAHQFLFTYLAHSNPADLVVTKPHSQGSWRIEKIFMLDDCVAVQMTEVHYL